MVGCATFTISILTAFLCYLLLQSSVLRTPSPLRLEPNSTYDYIIGKNEYQQGMGSKTCDRLASCPRDDLVSSVPLNATETGISSGSLDMLRRRRNLYFLKIGAGSAGCVLANRLSEDGKHTVLLLEAGDDDRNYWKIKVPGLATQTWQSSVSRQYYTEPQEHELKGLKYNRSFWLRGHVLGGSSNLNKMTYVRGDRKDYDRWAKSTGDESWNYSHVLPYFMRSEGVMVEGLRDSPYHSTHGPMPVSQVGSPPVTHKLVEAMQNIGYAFNEDYNGRTTEGVAYTQFNIRHGERWSSAQSFLHPILDRRNLDVVVNAQVDRVLIEGKAARGVFVMVNGKEKTVQAKKEVILSAGSLSSPQILMLSGIGPAHHLKEMGIPVKFDLPVGQNLQDHIMLPAAFSIEEPLSYVVSGVYAVYCLLWSGLEYFVYKTGMLSSGGPCVTAFSSVTPEALASDWPDLQIQFAPVVFDRMGADQSQMNILSKSDFGFTCFPTLLRPKSIGNITLRTKNVLDNVVIHANYLDKPEDAEVLLRGIDQCKRLSMTQVMQDIGTTPKDTLLPGICRTHQFDSDGYWTCVIKHTMQTAFHSVGTCKMGNADDPSTVVDPQLRVKGVSNLRVVDASIMPYITSENTHAPTVMIAEKAADMIRGRPWLQPLQP